MEVSKIEILALDLSTKNSGYAIYENQTLKDYGCISSKDNNLYNRIDSMVIGIEKIIKNNNIDKIIIEEVLPEDVKHNQNVFKALTYLQGFILHLFNRYNLNDINFFNASEWRKKCGIRTGQGIKRDELKMKDIKFIKEHFNIEVNDDIADAICIGYAFINKTEEKEIDISSYEEEGFQFK